MTLKQLRLLIASQPVTDDEKEVKVWLPGSRIALSFNAGRLITDPKDADTVMIEGNVDAGSALA